MLKKEIEELLSESAMPCVSIIVPMHRLSPERIRDRDTLQSAVNVAKKLLKQKYEMTGCNVGGLIQNIDEAVGKIDYDHSKDGIGIFTSPHMTRTVKFPFPVETKVKVGDRFDSKDLLYEIDSIIDYCVLSISKKHIHLFTGNGEDLREVKNEDFPILYVETYEYSKSCRGNSFGNSTLKAFERDKSVLQELRSIDFFKTADHLLEKNIGRHIPILVSGGPKEIADFLQVTRHAKRIIGKISGNYNFNGDLQLAHLSWQKVQRHLENRNKILLSNLLELIGKEMLAIGIEETWKAAKEGKGLELIVEKDFECHAFISQDENELKSRRPARRKKYEYVNDAVERTIKLVREKRGRVIFVDNGELSDFNRIALRLRYNNSN